MPEEAPGVTPTTAVTPPAMGTPAVQPSATLPIQPAVQPDTAARIATLEAETESLKARVRELNKESKDHRLAAEAHKAAGEAATALLVETGLKDFAEVKAALEKGRTLEADKAASDKRQNILEAAAAAGYGPDILGLEGAKDLAAFVKDEAGKDGKPAKIGLVKLTGADGKETEQPFGEYAAAMWPKLHEACKATPNGHKGAEVPLGYAGRMPAATPKEKTFEERKAEKMAASEYPTL